MKRISWSVLARDTTTSRAPKNLLVRRVEMASAGGTAGLVVDRRDNTEHALAVGGGEFPRPFRETDFHQWRLGVVADVAGLGFDVGDLLDFLGVVGKLDGPLFVVDADVLDLFQPGDVGDDLVDVVPGVQHHGVMRAELDGIAEAFRLGRPHPANTFSGRQC